MLSSQDIGHSQRQKTAADAYTYEVKGKYEREGEWDPAAITDCP